MRIPINLADYKEPTIAPAGKYDIIVATCEEGPSKGGKPQFRMSIGFEGHPEFQNMTHFLSIPGDKDTPDQLATKALMYKRFLSLLKLPIDPTGIDTEKDAMRFIGAKANVEVYIENEKDEAGNDKVDGRQFNRIFVPRMKNEPASTAARPPLAAAKS